MEGTYLLFGGITLSYVMIQLEYMLRIITAGLLCPAFQTGRGEFSHGSQRIREGDTLAEKS